MRKEYVKPVMESEEFVSNEYVAACWTITCTNSGKSCGFITAKDKYPEGLEVNGSIGVYSGDIGGSNGCANKFNPKDYPLDGDFIQNMVTIYKWLRDFFNNDLGSTTYYHPVSVTEGYEKDNTFHPNASV